MLKHSLTLFLLTSLSASSTYALAADTEQKHTAELKQGAELTLPDASHYRGSLQNGLLHGQGVLQWQEGDRYEGQFAGGLMHGQGSYYSQWGETYRGEFSQGSFTGEGSIDYGGDEHYSGQVKDWRPHGQGVYQVENGTVYQGEFMDGAPHGTQSVTYSNGDIYEGEMQNWELHGAGIFSVKEGPQYRGTFVNGIPDGEMVVHYPDGSRYEGGMHDWDIFHGHGRYVLKGKTVFAGNFSEGEMEGEFTQQKEDGTRYIGEMQDGLYHGKGKLFKANKELYEGDFEWGHYEGKGVLESPEDGIYRGHFRNGRYHGEGSLTYTNQAGESISLSGPWSRGYYMGDDAHLYLKEGLSRLSAEELLYAQPQRMAEALEALASGKDGQTDLFVLGFGSFASQDVFMKEIQQSTQVLERQYGSAAHTLRLVNNNKTSAELPLATLTNLRVALQGMGKKMNTEEDILLLYLSSHGSKRHQLAVELPGVHLQDLNPQQLKKLLDAAGIQWRVLIVSACYSGGYIEPLKDEKTMVITSASATTTSFGCSSDADLTYFGQAFLRDALGETSDLISAFAQAKQLIEQRESEEGLDPSLPQVATSPAIEQQWAKLPRIELTCTGPTPSSHGRAQGDCPVQPSEAIP